MFLTGGGRIEWEIRDSEGGRKNEGFCGEQKKARPCGRATLNLIFFHFVVLVSNANC